MSKLYVTLTLGIVILCIQFSPAYLAGYDSDKIVLVEDEFAEFDTEHVPEHISPRSLQSDDPSQSHSSKLNSQDDGRHNLRDKGTPRDDNPHKADDDQSTNKQTKKDTLKLVNAPPLKFHNWEAYYVEIAFILGFCLYFINYFIGSSKNTKFAYDWYKKSRDLLKQQFTLVGGAPQFNDGHKKEEDGEVISPTNKKQRGLIKATESMYTLWNSGRVGVDGLLIELNLLKRHDLASMGLNLIKPSKDTMILRFLLNQDGYENFVFCLAHKSHAQKMAREMVDINTFCPKRKAISQYSINNEKMFVMSELSDVASFILDYNMASFVEKYEQAINYIHITDQYSTIKSEEIQAAQKLAHSKRMATFSFSLPRNDKEVNDYMMFALNLLDRLRRFKLARDSKQKSDKNRQKINDIIQKAQYLQRQEAAQAKKEELRRLEKERIYNEDDPEKQRIWQKKEDKRELKRSKMRVKQLKVKSM